MPPAPLNPDPLEPFEVQPPEPPLEVPEVKPISLEEFARDMAGMGATVAEQSGIPEDAMRTFRSEAEATLGIGQNARGGTGLGQTDFERDVMESLEDIVSLLQHIAGQRST